MLPLSEWQTFFSVQAECAATLTGLVFVAVSINLARVLAAPGLPGRAAESIAQFMQVFFVCSALMISAQSLTTYGVEIAVVAFLSWLLQSFSQLRYSRVRSGHPLWW